MCGIVAAIAANNIVPVLIEGLKKLEYRGYDSAGVAVLNPGLTRLRSVGRVAELAVLAEGLAAKQGIAHTRWATHGVPSERNAHPHVSGALAVVEGVGDHGCEYMTGGTAVVLGATGRNFAAGMSGGIAYVYDEDGSFARKCNLSMVALETVLPAGEQPDDGLRHHHQADEIQLKAMIERHATHTGSERAKALLGNWSKSRARFVKVFPHEYRRALKEIAAGHLKEAA
jgi:glutamate synthase domain-containing protein 3